MERGLFYKGQSEGAHQESNQKKGGGGASIADFQRQRIPSRRKHMQRPCGGSLLDNFEQMNEMISQGFSRSPLAAEGRINQRGGERGVPERSVRGCCCTPGQK